MWFTNLSLPRRRLLLQARNNILGKDCYEYQKDPTKIPEKQTIPNLFNMSSSFYSQHLGSKDPGLWRLATFLSVAKRHSNSSVSAIPQMLAPRETAGHATILVMVDAQRDRLGFLPIINQYPEPIGIPILILSMKKIGPYLFYHKFCPWKNARKTSIVALHWDRSLCALGSGRRSRCSGAKKVAWTLAGGHGIWWV